MSEGVVVPFSADLAEIYAAVNSLNATLSAMGRQISANFERVNASVVKATEGMMKLQSGGKTMGAAQAKAAAESGNLAQKLSRTVAVAGNLGSAVQGAVSAINLANRASRAFAGVNLAQSLSGWISKLGGLKTALGAIPGLMRAVIQNRTFQIIAASAVAAYAAVMTVRISVKAVGIALSALRATASGAFSGMLSAARATASGMKSAFSGIASAPGKLLSLPGVPLAGLLSAAGAMALLVTQVKSGGESAGEIERLGISFTTLTGSAETAKTVLDSMRESWVKTGASIASQAPTIQKFIALGFDPTDAMKLQKNILDVAGAVGMTAENAELLGSALAQVKAKGVVSMEELRQQIAEKGVPVFEVLAQKLGVTQAALIKMVSDGKVPASELIDIFMNMEGSLGRFKGGAEKMGGTFLGLMSRIQGAWSLLRAEFMAPIVDTLKPILEGGIAKIQSFMESAKQLGVKVGNAVAVIFTAFRDGSSLSLFKAGLAVAFHGAVDILWRGIRGAVAFLGSTLPVIIQVALAKITDVGFWQGIGEILSGVGDSISASIREAFGNKEGAAAYDELGREKRNLGMMRIENAGGIDGSSMILKSLSDGMKFATEAAAGPATQGLQTATANFREAVSKLQATVDADRLKRNSANKETPQGDGQMKKSFTPQQAVSKAVAPAVMSLTRIGGGGFSNSVMTRQLAESKKQTNYLKIISEKINSNPNPRAVYA